MNTDCWGWYSVAVNVVLIAINAGIAVASGSLVVQAEMAHNLVDLLTAIGVLVGVLGKNLRSSARSRLR